MIDWNEEIDKKIEKEVGKLSGKSLREIEKMIETLIEDMTKTFIIIKRLQDIIGEKEIGKKIAYRIKSAVNELENVNPDYLYLFFSEKELELILREQREE
jgi:hypothetical protein